MDDGNGRSKEAGGESQHIEVNRSKQVVGPASNGATTSAATRRKERVARRQDKANPARQANGNDCKTKGTTVSQPARGKGDAPQTQAPKHVEATKEDSKSAEECQELSTPTKASKASQQERDKANEGGQEEKERATKQMKAERRME